MPKDTSKKEQRRVDISGRMLPHSSEAEQAVLSCALTNDNALMYALEELTPESFYTDSNKHIFSAMAKVRSQHSKVDIITLVNQLETDGEFESAGGMVYVSSLSNYVPDTSNYRNYVDIVKDKYILRRLVDSSSRTIEKAFDNNPSTDLLNDTEMEIYNIAKVQERGKLVSVANILGDVVNRIKDLEDPQKRLGISTGFAGINNITNGLQPSDLILIAARPSVGKTAFGMNIISNIALMQGKEGENKTVRRYSCAVFSLEMTKEQLTQRMLCSVAGVSMSRVTKGMTSKDDWKKLLLARKLLNDSNIYIDDTSMIKPMQIMEKCLRLKNQKGLDVVMIDYLQLLSSDNKRPENRQTEISEITRYLKIMAKELNVPVLLLSQLSRKVEERTDKTPMLSDLRESGAIEQDADIVMFIHRNFGLKEQELADKDKVEIIFAKHRNGELGRVPLKWIGESVRFADDENYLNQLGLDSKTVSTAPKLKNSYDPQNAPAVGDEDKYLEGVDDYRVNISDGGNDDEITGNDDTDYTNPAVRSKTKQEGSSSGSEITGNDDTDYTNPAVRIKAEHTDNTTGSSKPTKNDTKAKKADKPDESVKEIKNRADGEVGNPAVTPLDEKSKKEIDDVF